MERDYKSDQDQEVEALDAIYATDFEVIETTPFHKFMLPISTEDHNTEDESGITCKLVFKFTPKYPDEGPEIEIENENFEDEALGKRLIEHLNECIAENLGMEMIFTLVCAGQEWLNQEWDKIKIQKEEETERLKLAAEEAERKRFEGTRVTVESFLAWRKQFELETGITANKEKVANAAKKLTGKELFLRDTTLNESDLKFLLEAGDSIENVKIDESLFENIDLGSEDEDDDDPDYVPGGEDSD